MLKKDEIVDLQAEDRIKQISELKSFYLPYKKSFKIRGWFIGENDAERDTPLVDSNTLDNEGWRDILCMKRIMPSDCFRVINVYDWETGKIYSEYDDSKELDKLSPAYYVLNGTNVYKCISNNSNEVSAAAPTGVDVDAIEITSDNYHHCYILFWLRKKKCTRVQFPSY